MSEVLGKFTDGDILGTPMQSVTPTKPIRMGEPRHFSPMHVVVGDSIQFTLKNCKRWGGWLGGREVFQETLPIKRAMSVDTCIPMEVIDDFGLDVGVGFLIGQRKK